MRLEKENEISIETEERMNLCIYKYQELLKEMFHKELQKEINCIDYGVDEDIVSRRSLASSAQDSARQLCVCDAENCMAFNEKTRTCGFCRR